MLTDEEKGILDYHHNFLKDLDTILNTINERCHLRGHEDLDSLINTLDIIEELDK